METKKFFVKGDVWQCAGGAKAEVTTVDPVTGGAQVRQTSLDLSSWLVDAYGRMVSGHGKRADEGCPANLVRLLTRADGHPVVGTTTPKEPPVLDFDKYEKWVRRDEMVARVSEVLDNGGAWVHTHHGRPYFVDARGRVSQHMLNAADLVFREPEQQAAVVMTETTQYTKESNPKEAIGDKKVPMWLGSAIAKAHWAAAQFAGLLKYGAWNWRVAGVRTSTYISAMLRHIDRYSNGERLDPVDGTHHLGNVMACAAILLEAEYLKKLNDDRSPPADLGDAFAEVEAIMARLKTQYADKNPHHHTINDSNPELGL